MLSGLISYVHDHEEWLMGRILEYARCRGYTTYTSTLKEAWRLSISGLSGSLAEAVRAMEGDLELSPDQDYTRDPATRFGIVEARRHRERGVRFDMFLGLMKYYRQAYEDLIEASGFDRDEKRGYVHLLRRFFDRVEMGFCTAWSGSEEDKRIRELQTRNLLMTNEKNKYLTIFESLSVPVFIVDREGKIENMNHVAANRFGPPTVSGARYYKEHSESLFLTREFPWLTELYDSFVRSGAPEMVCEKSLRVEDQYFYISCSRSLDISGKFSGTVVIGEDITHRKKMEKELEYFATTDPLTGARNRRSFLQLFDQELTRSHRYGHSMALLMMDIDHFKVVNDTYGHDAGDRVLKLVVAESVGVLRDSDLFARWGGEEFIALLPETDLHKASIVAERLRSNLARIEVGQDSGACITFTVSIGFTVVRDACVTMDELIRKSDEALYLAKQQGRNRVVLVEGAWE